MSAPLLRLAESGRVPDSVVRWGIRRLLDRRLASLRAASHEDRLDRLLRFVDALREAPIAVHTPEANAQHYEVPAAFFTHVLGPHLKYSAALWPPRGGELEAAEAAMLALTCERAGLEDGQTILELGCGWGSLSLWMAAHYPAARITAVSNSASQRAFIESRARERGLANLSVITADMPHFAPEGTVDRVVSVEMFEHMRNVPALLERIAGWLNPGGRLFVHVFCHREFAYLFETGGATDWMGRYFFTGGMMPAEDLYLRMQDHLLVERQWRVNGRHYARTLRAWLERLDAAGPAVEPVLQQVYGAEAAVWCNRWRLFLMACEELFAYRDGEEWYVAHYRFRKRG